MATVRSRTAVSDGPSPAHGQGGTEFRHFRPSPSPPEARSGFSVGVRFSLRKIDPRLFCLMPGPRTAYQGRYRRSGSHRPQHYAVISERQVSIRFPVWLTQTRRPVPLAAVRPPRSAVPPRLCGTVSAMQGWRRDMEVRPK